MSVRKAAQLFESFAGEPGKPLGYIDLAEIDSTLVVIGSVEAIAYNAMRDGRRQSYQHEFRTSSRPVLAVSVDGSRLYLLAGAYEFTDRGIEDR